LKKLFKISFLRKIPALLLVFACFYLPAQNTGIDSLKKLVDNLPDDTNKVNVLISLSAEYFGTAPLQTILYSELAKDLAGQLNYYSGLALALKNQGIGYYLQSNNVDALSMWENALDIYISLNDKSGIANMYSNMGAIYFDESDNEKALGLYLKALKVAEEINDTLRIATVQTNIGAIYGSQPNNYDLAIEFDLKALELSEILGDKDAIGTLSGNLGEIYLQKGDDTLALTYFEKALVAYEGSANAPHALYNLGRVYTKRNNFELAFNYYQQAYDLAQKLDAKKDMSESLIRMGQAYAQKGDINKSLNTLLKAREIAVELNNNEHLKEIYEGLGTAYSELSDFKNAFRYQNLLLGVKDSLFNIAAQKKLNTLLFNFEIDKKQSEIDLLTKDQELKELALARQKMAKNSLMAGLGLVFIILFILYRGYRTKVRINKILDKQKIQIEGLLLNILPQEVANELQTEGHATPQYYDNVSVLFTDFKGFTHLAEGLAPHDLVSELNDCFIAFDDIIEKNGLEKIKTIGDSYMCAGGIPLVNEEHYVQIIQAGLEIQEFMRIRNLKRTAMQLPAWELRIGIHTGPVVAGVVGRKKYAYDIWGNTVNIASRMESNGEPGKVNISAVTFNLIKDHFECRFRGKISAKNIGEIEMYFVENRIEKSAGTPQPVTDAAELTV
jgi:adenylate cyclase